MTITVAPEAAAALEAVAELKAEAGAAGLTGTDIDAELAAYNAERRDARVGD